MGTKTKKFKTETQGYYFTYSDRQNPYYKDQTDRFASLYRESDNQLIQELNTEADKVHGIDAFTHKEVIGWFDSILNPSSNILSGVRIIEQERARQINNEKCSKEHDSKHVNAELSVNAVPNNLT